MICLITVVIWWLASSVVMWWYILITFLICDGMNYMMCELIYIYDKIVNTKKKLLKLEKYIIWN